MDPIFYSGPEDSGPEKYTSDSEIFGPEFISEITSGSDKRMGPLVGITIFIFR